MQYYLIFLSLKYPDNLYSYFNALGISNGNFLPNPFKRYLIKKDPFPGPPEKFVEENNNTDFIMNTGQFLMVWIFILIGLSITLLLFKFLPKIAIIRFLKKSYLFSILLRIGIETFLPISLSVLLQMREISEPNQNIGYISLALSSFCMIYLILTFPLIIWQVTIKSDEELSTKSHKRRFGTIYEIFKTNSKVKSSFLLFQNMRRVVLVIFCVFLYDHPTAQATLSTILSFLYISILIILRPFKAGILGNRLHIVSETFYFLAHCIILKFLDDQLSDRHRIKLCWIVISLMSFSILIHLVSLFIVQIHCFIKGIKHLKDKFMKTFANKFVKRAKNMKTITLDNKALYKRENNKIDDINTYVGFPKNYEESDGETNYYKKSRREENLAICFLGKE